MNRAAAPRTSPDIGDTAQRQALAEWLATLLRADLEAHPDGAKDGQPRRQPCESLEDYLVRLRHVAPLCDRRRRR